MSELEGLIERLRLAYSHADRLTPGPFSFVSSVTSLNGDCTCVLVVARDTSNARKAAAEALVK